MRVAIDTVASSVHLDGALLRGPVWIAQTALIELAIRIARQRVDKIDAPGHFVARHAPLQKIQQLGARLIIWGLLARQQLDNRFDFLAPFRIGNAEHRHIRHARMG